MKEIVIKFIYNEIEYIVYKGEDKYIPCKIENNNISFDLTNEELSIINSVFNKVKVTDNKIKLSNIEYNSKLYQHFYDKTNNWNIFLNIDGTDITKEELSTFNNLFNYQDDKMYMASSIDDKKDSFIKRLVKIGKKTIVALVLSTSLISPLTTLTTVQGKEIKNEVVEVEEKEELSAYQKIENLKKAINDNESLTKKEKEFMLSKFDIIYDNIDLIDYELVIDRFDDIYMEYEEDRCDYGNIAAYYSPSDNYIHSYGGTCIDDIDESVLTHEFFHTLQGERHYNPGIFEPLNDILVNEYEGVKKEKYYRCYSTGYEILKPYIYELTELVGSEALRYYNFTGDTSKIESELINLIDDESKVHDLFYNLDVMKDILIRDGIYANLGTAYSLFEDNVEDILGEYVEAKTKKSRYSDVDYVFNTHPDSFEKFLKDECIKYEYDCGIIYCNNNYKKNGYDGYYIKTKIENNDNLDYNETIEYLKSNKIIDDENYNSLKEEYELYSNKKISLEDLNDYLLDCVGVFYINSENNNIVFVNVYGKNKDFLIGKEEKIKDNIKNESEVLKYFYYGLSTYNCIDYSQIFNLDEITLESKNGELIFKRHGKSYKFDTEYSKKIINFLNKEILNGAFYSEVNYGIKGNILSIYNNEESYNINLKTGKKVGIKKLLKKTNTTKEQIAEQAISDIQNIVEMFYDEEPQEEVDMIMEEIINKFLNKGITNAYIDKNGLLSFNVEIDDLCEKITIGVPIVKEKVYG